MPKDKVRVGILRGGLVENYADSLVFGGDLISHLHEHLSDKYTPIDILIDKNGIWHAKGRPILPVDLVHKVDVIWNLSHPSFSNIIESFSIPNIGVPPFFSFLQHSRQMLHEHMQRVGIKMPRHLVFSAYQQDFDGDVHIYAEKKAHEVFNKFSAPWIVKSLVPGGETGIHVAKTFPELINAIADLVLHQQSILVEELIEGKNIFTHSLSGFRGSGVYVFPVNDFVPNFEHKFSPGEKEKITNTAIELHKHLGVRHYLKSDFVLHPRRGIFLTGYEFQPDLASDSHLHHSCMSVGTKLPYVVEHILESALR